MPSGASRTALRESPVWIYGAAGSGKSHLLQAACAQAGRRERDRLPAARRQLRRDGPALLDGFEHLDLVALDDLDAIAGDDALGIRRSSRSSTGSRSTAGGLRSRPLAAPASRGFACRTSPRALQHRRCIALEPLAEPEQAARAAARAERRGLELPDETLGFLTRRAPRDFATLCRMLDALDTESLAAQRRLTVPFVRDWLARNGG